MVRRQHNHAGMTSEALYSPCGRYRYALTREWGEGPRLLYVMLNPSKATEVANDPTVERCERRARALGFGAFRVSNIFAWRETDPRALRRAADPEGPQNDAVLRSSARDWLRGPDDMLLCGWGVHGAHRDRGPAVTRLLCRAGRPLHCLGLSKAGHPRHPLYIAYAQQPVVWNVPPAVATTG
ncbi:DUF1643 domain-containing protein [Pseudooceanicola aestuarii]|uniref:DUF1643 domain-containing protein n=1 Tax=Pseudooceanicola aestuarii TaxID=2697319 RepID=UPI003B830937